MFLGTDLFLFRIEFYATARLLFIVSLSENLLLLLKVLWKSYIDFEIENEERDKARKLYKRLLERTQHLKVWMSYAAFEVVPGEKQAIEKSR